MKGKSYCSLQLPNIKMQRKQSHALARGRVLKVSCTDDMRNDGHMLEKRKCSLDIEGEMYHGDDWAPEQAA